MHRARFAIPLLLGLAVTAAAPAGEVQLRAESANVYVGVPFAVAIDVSDKTGHAPPQFPPLESAEVSGPDVSSSSSSSFQITINGRQVSQSSKTTRYLFRVTPQEPGTLRIPAIEVEVDGERLQTKPAVFRVSRAETGDLMYVRLVAEKDSVYVGEPLDVTLEIWLRPFEQDRVELDFNEMWRMLDLRSSQWGPFLELLERDPPEVRVRTDQRTGLDDLTRTYYVYELRKRIWPERPGDLISDGVRVVGQYPIRLTRSRDFFGMGQLRVAEAKPIAATIDGGQPQVKPVPTQGRPPYYTGAVGPHLVFAKAAPTEARVGDPITLTLTVAGKGRLDSLQAPSLAELPAFAGRFQVAEDQLPGVVEQNQKRFTQSIRALRADVTEVPPIPFAYFDPDQERFVTVYTDPIPLKIAAAERLSTAQIVESAEGTAALRSLTTLQAGIEGNYTDPHVVLAQQGFHPSVATAAVSAGAPLVYVACALVLRRRRKLASNVALLRQRGARKAAHRRLREAEQRGDVTAAMSALLIYVADRLDLPPGGLTREEAVARLRERGVDETTAARTDEALMAGEAAQFAGGGGGSSDDLPQRIRECIEALERVRL